MIFASLVFVAVSSLLGCFLCLLAGHLTPAIAIFSLLVGLGAAGYGACKNHLKFDKNPISVITGFFYAVIGIGIYYHAVFLFYRKGENLHIFDPFNLGDLSFHFGLIRFFAKGGAFWPENLILMGHRLKYPFGPDFFNSFFEILNVPISTHLPLVTLLGLFLVLATLHGVGGPLAVFAIFFSGGVYNFMQTDSWDLFRIQDVLAWKNLFLTVLVTQRGFVYALPVGLYLYGALKKYFAGEWQPTLVEKIFLGILWGSLGFFHLHSFFYLSLFLGLWILYRKALREFWPVIAIASILAVGFVINAILPEPGGRSIISWAWGWTRAEGENYLMYWARNLGVWLVMSVGAAILFYRRHDKQNFFLMCLSLGTFVLFAHLILAPWAWDNIKLLIWSYLFGVIGISELFWKRQQVVVQWAVAGVLCLPGYLLFIHGLPMYNKGAFWTSARELNKAEVLLKDQDVNVGLVVKPEYNHPALLLGYKLYLGYPGHVWSHGLEYGDREKTVKSVYAGEMSPELPKNLLIYYGPLEKKEGNAAPMLNALTKVNTAGDHELFLYK